MTDDPYRRLEDASAPEVSEWTEKQESAYQAAADGWRARESLYAELTSLSERLGVGSAPRPAGGRLFLTRVLPGAEHPELVVVEPSGAVRVLVDPARADPSGGTTLEEWEPSWDGRLLSYQLAPGGREDAALYVLDVDSGRLVDGPIDRVRRTTVAWLPDGSGFYYVRRLHPSLNPGEGQYHRRVRLHLIGTDADDDPVIFGTGREKTQHYTVRVSADGRWLVVSAAAGTAPRKDVWLADLTAAPLRAPLLRTVQEGVDARSLLHIRPGTDADGRCYLSTDLHTRRGRVVTATPGEPTPETWTDLIPEDPEAVLEDFAILDGPESARPVMLVVRTRHAVSEITVHDLADGSLLGSVPIPPCGTVGKVRVAASDAHQAWFVYTDFGTPPVVLRYDARTGALDTWPVPGTLAPVPTPDLTTRQVTFTSLDGTLVRMFVIARRDTPDRPRPTLLTGYGGFAQSLTPAYSPEAIAWVRAGGVYAVANLRGGGEEGEDWHRAGMLDRKQNTFDDFHAAAGHLVASGWTTSRQLGIWGASNGGLLVGVALTQRPAAYGAVVCMAPLLDMARYELFGLGPSWVGEYGSATDPDQYAYLLTYSPYHHVRSGTAYPAVLLAVFDGDSRVDPLHARKMCAALQDSTSSGKPILFRLERGAGHGARATSRRAALFADTLAFFTDQLGPIQPVPDA
ncbi:prolyl oligopeptidase family serine peptidase [Streptomyces sp. SID3343]|uniref:prolyl oligopeptidase family serine peptidase n=1 Tax=Streptomyces sp. SID3343 TaxID=2690260 RepID=UPI00136DCFF3|nr:prolyl oligopeptidase family serine peptidase [Streptomyces sp. SID3343]MYV97599.1 prolyl oligopeptidase family serine peptidase [Streptomyces sp. SID3343]